MASAFGHALSAIALGSVFKSQLKTWKFWILGVVCSILPDADVITFQYGIPYESFWGHRGFTHSLLFALLVGVLITLVFYGVSTKKSAMLWLMVYFSICTASHSLLDAMTSGGLGVAFFSPWDNTRYFLPWRPIKVSPIGIDNFLGEWGIRVLKSELIWIGIPSVALIVIGRMIRRKKNPE